MSSLAQETNSGPVSDKAVEILATRSGLRLHVRPAVAADEAGLKVLFEGMTLEDLRFRFLSAVQHVGHDQIVAMLRVDHIGSETFVAFEPENDELVATAMLAADPTLATAEVAISVHRDYKGRGIGWALLKHVADIARAKGVGRLQAIESRENHAAIELEREMGFKAHGCPGEPALMLVEAVLNERPTPVRI
jgi:GNAT superfamily N-acetyltransferase